MRILKIIFLISFFFSSQLLYAKSLAKAESIFRKSIKLFSLPNISFIIDSNIVSKHFTEKRSFFLAKQSESLYNYSLLIRFISPIEIKCTSVLVVNKEDEAKRYAYFPSLNRVRMIPAKDENKEVFGIGISYHELSNKKGDFTAVSTIKKDHKTFDKLVLVYKNQQTNYYINQANKLLENIEIIRNNTLIKKISILETIQFNGNKMIKKWRVEDLEQEKYIDFNIRKESVTDKINKSLFFKNRLEICTLKAF